MDAPVQLYPASVDLVVKASDGSLFPNFRLRVTGSGHVTVTQGLSSSYETLRDYDLIEKRAINDQGDAEYFLTEHAWELFADLLDPLRSWAGKLPVDYDPEAVMS